MATYDRKRQCWNDPHEVSMRDILTNARSLIADEDYSVRDAIYASAVNGESDSAAVNLIFRNGCQPVMPKPDVLAHFDEVIKSL